MHHYIFTHPQIGRLAEIIVAEEFDNGTVFALIKAALAVEHDCNGNEISATCAFVAT